MSGEALQQPTARTRRFFRFGSEVIVGLYEPDGRVVGEFVVQWRPRADATPMPCLEAFHDAWGALAAMPDVLRALAVLADKMDLNAALLCDVLEALGFVDGGASAEPRKPSR